MRPALPDVGPSVDGYEVQDVLGRGASGVVYRVRDPQLKRDLALKLLTHDQDEESRARFRIEAQAAARVIHPNVVQVYGAGQYEGRPYILQELVDGLPVSQLLQARGRIAAPAVIELGLQAAEGLAEAARMGVLHRDVKPHNLLLTDSGQLKLADFGLAKLLHAPSGLTERGTTLGTPHYMSPEQGQGEALDHRSDQYALGATLYHLLAGQPPFDAHNALALLRMHAQDELPSLAEACPECSPALVQVVQRMLRKQPSERFACFEDLIDALERAQDDAEQGAGQLREMAPMPAAPATRTPWSWLRTGLPVLGAAAAVAVIFAVQVLPPKPATTTGRTVAAGPTPMRALASTAESLPTTRDPFAREGINPARATRVRTARRSTPQLLADLRKGPRHRVAAAHELGRRADQRATFPLLKVLEFSRSPEVAQAAAGALAQLGDIRALEPLRVLTTEGRSAAVRSAAGDAHRKLYRVEE